MESLIGLGKAGCNIVSLLKNHPVYNDFYIDTGIKGARHICLPEYENTEDYDTNKASFKRNKSQIHNKVHFFMAGSGKVSGASLRMLEQIKKHDLNVCYIKSDPDGIGSIATKRERVSFNVLQQFARSGLLEDLILVDNLSLEVVIGDVPLIGYYDRLNELLSTTYHMINVYKNSRPIMGSPDERSNIARISTIGILNTESGEEKLFYPMERITEKAYFFAFNEEKLKTDGTLGKKIKEIMRKKLDKGTKISYNVYTTQYEQDYGYCVARTSVIQGEE
jgi:hypothetical protein